MSSLGTVLSAAAWSEFEAGFHGRLVRPTDIEYEEARKVWNGMIDRHPALIARCDDTEDVIRSVQFAQDHDLLVAVRGGGHNVAGFGTCDGGMVIDLSLMKAIECDVAACNARAQGGLTWGEFDKVTQEHALATTGGLVSTTGIAGFTLGGGIGWLTRKYGLASDNLLSVRVVTADGRCVTASEKENPDLFWGIRGGGGNFGIVTEFTYQLHPLGPNVFGGTVFYPFDQAEEILRFYRGWSKNLTDEMATIVAFLTAPPAPFVPVSYQGTKMISIAACFMGTLEQGLELVKPLREFATPVIDLLGPLPYTVLQGMFDATAPKGILSYWKSEYLRSLDDETINTLLEQVGRMQSPFSTIHIYHMEGAMKRIDPHATAFGHRDAPFVLNIIGEWMEPADSESNIAWVRDAWAAIQPYSDGNAYLNFLDQDDARRVQNAYGVENYHRLLTLKKKYDPTNLFRLNHNINPGEA